MCWCNKSVNGVNYTDNSYLHAHTLQELKEAFDEELNGWDKYWEIVPAWSLSALLELLPEGGDIDSNEVFIQKEYAPYLQKENGTYHVAYGNDVLLCEANNPIDAVVELIVKLKKEELI